MNRRYFITAMLKAGVAAAVLPAATTYARRWVKANDLFVPEPTRVWVIDWMTLVLCPHKPIVIENIKSEWTITNDL